MLTFLEYLTKRERNELAKEKAAHSHNPADYLNFTPVDRWGRITMNYSDIGHGRTNDKEKVYLWYYDPRLGKLSVRGPHLPRTTTHCHAFSTKQNLKFRHGFTGRYVVDTGIVTISPGYDVQQDPDKMNFVIRHELLPALSKKFDIKKHIIFIL